MPRYAILTPVKRGGTVHRDSIVLSEKDAAQLLASGAIELRETGADVAQVAHSEPPAEHAPGQMTPARARVSDNKKKPRRRTPAATDGG